MDRYRRFMIIWILSATSLKTVFSGCSAACLSRKCPIQCGTCLLMGICSVCPSGYYGDLCNQRCPSGCMGWCDQHTGVCGDCPTDYTGSYCDKKCPTGCEGECNMFTEKCFARYYSFLLCLPLLVFNSLLRLI